MRDDDRVRILHMIDAAEAVAQFIDGRSRADLDQDRMLLFSAKAETQTTMFDNSES